MTMICDKFYGRDNAQQIRGMLTDYPPQEENIDFQLRKMFSDTSLVTEISLTDSGDMIFI